MSDCEILEVIIRKGISETGCATIMLADRNQEELAIKPGESHDAFIDRVRSYAAGRGATQIIFEGMD